MVLSNLLLLLFAVFQDSDEYQDDTQKDQSLYLYYNDGIRLDFPSKDFSLKINAWISSEARSLSDRSSKLEDADVQENSGLLMRSSRFVLGGDFAKVWRFKFATEFAGDVALNDAYLEFAAWKQLVFRVGQFKVPFSLEQMTPIIHIPTITRTVGDQFTPRRDSGIMLYGLMFDEMISYAFSVYNGDGINAGAKDLKDGKREYAARVGASPFYFWKDSLLQGMYFGGGYTSGEVKNTKLTDVRTLDTGTKIIDIFDTGSLLTKVDGKRQRYGYEFEYTYGSLGVRVETFKTKLDLVRSVVEESGVQFLQNYILLNFILTGEKKIYNTPLKPAKPFNWEKGTFGACELVAKYSIFSVSEILETAGFASMAASTDEIESMTFGFNWIPMEHMLFAINVLTNTFGDDITVSGETISDERAILILFQIAF
ncbi:MAG: hypothetical protein HY606_11525 [Planctomycetes bacterium]|nr:hypothetical protein [Planctomycetota bacterium]